MHIKVNVYANTVSHIVIMYRFDFAVVSVALNGLCRNESSLICVCESDRVVHHR